MSNTPGHHRSIGCTNEDRTYRGLERFARRPSEIRGAYQRQGRSTPISEEDEWLLCG